MRESVKMGSRRAAKRRKQKDEPYRPLPMRQRYKVHAVLRPLNHSLDLICHN